MTELGCFFVEAWRADTDHHRGKYSSYDPKLNTEEHCLSFPRLLQQHDNDVRTALKVARIQLARPPRS